MFDECVFEEPLDLRHAKAESLSLRGCVVPVLSASGLQVKRDLTLSAARIGCVDLFGASIGGQVWLNGAQVRSGTDDWAISAPQITVVGGLYCSGLTADGGVNLWGGEIGASLEMDGATVTSEGRPALRAPNLTVGIDLSLAAAEIRGGIDLFGAKIGGQVWLNGAQVRSDTDDWAISAPQVTVAGGFYGGRMVADGGMNLWGAEISAAIELAGAALTAADRPALRATNIHVEGDLDLTNDVKITGTVDLTAATVGGRLKITDALFGADGQPTVNLSAARLGTLHLGAISGPHLSLDLRGAAITSLHDDPDSWPDRLWLDRLSYNTLRPHLPPTQRLAWIQRDPEAHHPQPYVQLADHYRSAGYDHDARTVLLAKQRSRRQHLNLPARVWGYLQDALVGYGYRPARAFGWLILLVAVLATATALQQPRPTSTPAPSFNPVIYAVDVVLPLIDLDQQRAYSPVGTGRWVAWLATLGAWTLASAIAAAISRTIVRD
jgi:hypothetical protein